MSLKRSRIGKGHDKTCVVLSVVYVELDPIEAEHNNDFPKNSILTFAEVATPRQRL